jgi:hypothetical protein
VNQVGDALNDVPVPPKRQGSKNIQVKPNERFAVKNNREKVDGQMRAAADSQHPAGQLRG